MLELTLEIVVNCSMFKSIAIDWPLAESMYGRGLYHYVLDMHIA